MKIEIPAILKTQKRLFLLSVGLKNYCSNYLSDFTLSLKTKLMVRARKILMSRDGECHEITQSTVICLVHLSSNQEEADTKVILHTMDALNMEESTKVHLRSPSGDTDILVLAIALVSTPNHVYYDYGTGKNRKCVRLDQYDVPHDERDALIGFHAVTGNDYTPAFFRKGKNKCWKTMKSKEVFLTASKILVTVGIFHMS